MIPAPDKLPGLAAVAMQTARHAARTDRAARAGGAEEQAVQATATWGAWP